MLVHVVPPTAEVQLAAVVFSIVFEDLDAAATPSTWTTQLNNLRLDELEVPTLVHALDKSTGILCLLEEVTFDLSTSTISCRFVDGSMEQWALVGEKCIKALERVLQDVNDSSLALERELEEKQRERRRFEVPLLPPPTKASRHKKQRSLLMTLVASIIPLSSPTNSRLPSPPPTPMNERKPSPTISPRDCRRRARSDLVDAFRLYVLSELSKRFPRGGYTTWIIRSMVRRVTETMQNIINEADGSTDSESGLQNQNDRADFYCNAPESSTPTQSVCDDDGETILTDTDGSSVHTPTSLHVRCAPIPVKRHSYVSRSPRRLLSEHSYALYMQHSALVGRLRKLAVVDQDRQEQEAEELRQHYRLLETQGKRRAWLNQTLTGSVRNQNVDLGMSTVFKSSSLAQNSWSSEEYEYVPEDLSQSIQRRQEYEEYDKVQLRTKRSQRCLMTPKLFPVSEEDDEDVDDAVLIAQEFEFDFDFEVDLEAGTRWPDSDESFDNELDIALPASFDTERLQLRPRVRTSSIHKPPLRVPLPIGPEPERRPSPHLTASLIQSLSSAGQITSQDDILTPVYTEVDVNMNVNQVTISRYGGFDKSTENELTLAMDLPISVRCEDHGNSTNKRRLGFDSHHSWVSSRSSPPSGLEDVDDRLLIHG
ncbi:hypothetical protein C0993_012603 [Termitomyces sp. T159_Od127]|nr:hypothetical protein C0993_012603 [Termitomyces sp. T159_Od127]